MDFNTLYLQNPQFYEWHVREIEGQSDDHRLLVLQGPAGSGKTEIARQIEANAKEQNKVIFFGPVPKSVEVPCSKCDLVIFDNVLIPHAIPIDNLIACLNGATIKRRKLYTENETVDIIPKAAIVITTTNMRPFREDLESRTIRITLSKWFPNV